MRSLLAAAALVATLLSGASPASAVSVGANDDTGKFLADDGSAVYQDMAALGLQQIVLAARFKPSQPLVIQDRDALDRTIPRAVDAGLRVVLAVYPYPPRELEAGIASPALFGAHVAALAQAFPDVRQFVIGNEPNQPAFWRPQFAGDGSNASAAAFGPYLASAYDALKALDPRLSVVGVGLSPRGNDRPDARSNVSTSPVRFLRALGAWYRASGRQLPLMDGFSFHPYPNRATDPLDRGYAWPNAGFVDLGRVKQALWDAFHGTAQPTTPDGLKIHLDEVGWQVSTSGRSGYQGLENVVVTDELTQAAIYADLVRRASCDTDVAEVSFFGFRDDGARTGFQAALQRLDGSQRPAAEAVRDAIAGAALGCGVLESPWHPDRGVLDPTVDVRTSLASPPTVRLRAGEDARARVCATPRVWARGLYTRSARALGSRCTATPLTGLRPSDVVLPLPAAARGSVDVTVELVAEANHARRTVVSRTALLR